MPRVSDDELKALDTAYAVACVEHAYARRLANEAAQKVHDASRKLVEAKARRNDK